MSDKFDRFDDLMDDDPVEEFDVLVLNDDETGEEIELVVIDKVVANGSTYLLVVETDELENDESVASIIKEIESSADDMTYEIVDDDDEFEKICKLFSDKDNFEYKQS